MAWRGGKPANKPEKRDALGPEADEEAVTRIERNRKLTSKSKAGRKTTNGNQRNERRSVRTAAEEKPRLRIIKEDSSD